MGRHCLGSIEEQSKSYLNLRSGGGGDESEVSGVTARADRDFCWAKEEHSERCHGCFRVR